MSIDNKEIVLSVKDLKVNFSTDYGYVKAVRGVSFDLYKGETLCIVGESGSGKSVTSKTIMGILGSNGRIIGGSIMYEGEDLTKVSEDEFHRIRGNKIGMIFQDPLSSLNPIVKIGKQITEAMLINSSRLKKKYNDLVAPELVDYKNAETEYKTSLNALKDKVDFLKGELKKELDKIGVNKKEVKAEYKLKIKETKKDNSLEKKQLKAKYLPLIKEKKIVFNKRSSEAKKEVKQYKNELKTNYLNNKSQLKEKFVSNSSSYSNEDYKKDLKQLKSDYISTIKVTKKEAKDRALKIMEEVGIPQPEKRFKQYPFEFSGGMRQRIVIAIALTANPDIIICDEPTTALDVTIQAQILELINRLKKERNMSCIFITHDLGVVANMADRVAVMYAGKIVEYGTEEDIFYDPRHPYTWALLSSIPDVDSKEKLEAIPGTPPNTIYPPKGDAFALRSKYAMAVDFKKEPPMFKISDTHFAATWLLDPRAPKVKMPKIVETRIKNSLKLNKEGGKK